MRANTTAVVKNSVLFIFFLPLARGLVSIVLCVIPPFRMAPDWMELHLPYQDDRLNQKHIPTLPLWEWVIYCISVRKRLYPATSGYEKTRNGALEPKGVLGISMGISQLVLLHPGKPFPLRRHSLTLAIFQSWPLCRQGVRRLKFDQRP